MPVLHQETPEFPLELTVVGVHGLPKLGFSRSLLELSAQVLVDGRHAHFIHNINKNYPGDVVDLNVHRMSIITVGVSYKRGGVAEHLGTVEISVSGLGNDESLILDLMRSSDNPTVCGKLVVQFRFGRRMGRGRVPTEPRGILHPGVDGVRRYIGSSPGARASWEMDMSSERRHLTDAELRARTSPSLHGQPNTDAVNVAPLPLFVDTSHFGGPEQHQLYDSPRSSSSSLDLPEPLGQYENPRSFRSQTSGFGDRGEVHTYSRSRVGVNDSKSATCGYNGWVPSPQPRAVTQPTVSNMSTNPRTQYASSGSSHFAKATRGVGNSRTSRTLEDTMIQGANMRNLSESTGRLPHEREQIPIVIQMIHSGEDPDTITRSLIGDDIRTSIDALDEAIDRHNLPSQTRRVYLKVLYKLCGHHALLPRVMYINVSFGRVGGVSYRGGFADVWKGEHRGRDVAVKVIRTYSDSDLQRIIGKFCKEVVVWKTLRHRNVLPLIGVMISENHFAMISDWMENGNIGDFVKTHPGVNRIALLEGVAKGLIYIHDQGMIHGDLKGVNILVDQTGTARLADFGLLTIISEPANLSASSSYAHGGTARWMSPELIDPREFGCKKYQPTKASDCYALGMVVYEIISGRLPFYDDTNFAVVMKVLKGDRPHRCNGFTDELWRMLKSCWSPQANARPHIKEVLLCLKQVSNPPPVGGRTRGGRYSDFSDSAVLRRNVSDNLGLSPHPVPPLPDLHYLSSLGTYLSVDEGASDSDDYYRGTRPNVFEGSASVPLWRGSHLPPTTRSTMPF